ncbi:MAG: MBL fold metallo-hydrolase [Peptococcaceae bacterium]|nr:MBL fold metallo-hydrolase [Peptococcaceae bacterium]
MIQQLLPDLYRIPVPLPKNPLKEINTYLIRGERDFLIDTGFDLDICEQALLEAFEQLGVNKDKLDICLTHFHSDHIGLVRRLAKEETVIWSGKIPWETLTGWEDREKDWIKEEKRFAVYGLNANEEEWRFSQRPEFNLGWKKLHERFQILQEGQFLHVGDYALQCVETDGHCKGHICLYEPSKKILFSGDHILGNISPNITCYHLGEMSSLNQFLKSLDKIAGMDVELVLPGHRQILTNCAERIKELKLHHQNRLIEVMSILKEGPRTGVEIAGQMSWAMSYTVWDEISPVQKFFSLGEALAHVNYLVEKGFVKTKNINEVIYFYYEKDFDCIIQN